MVLVPVSTRTDRSALVGLSLPCVIPTSSLDATMPAESRRVTRSRSGDSSAASAPVAASRAPAQPPTRKRARGARGDKEQQEQEAAEEGAEEEEDGNDGASSNGDDDDSDDGEDEEEEDEGELIFAGRSVRGEWVSGTLTYADSKRLHYRGEFKNGVKSVGRTDTRGGVRLRIVHKSDATRCCGCSPSQAWTGRAVLSRRIDIEGTFR